MPKSERKTERSVPKQKERKVRTDRRPKIERKLDVPRRALRHSTPIHLIGKSNPKSSPQSRTPVRFRGDVHRRTLTNGTQLTIGVQEAPSAVSAIDMDRRFELQSQPNGNLRIRFNLPLCDISSSISDYELGAAFAVNSALNDTVVVGSTILLNPLSMECLAYGATTPQLSMGVPSSPHIGLQSLAYTGYRVPEIGFSYQPQGQTEQTTTATLAESRLRFCYTSDPTHPIIGYMAYRGSGTIDYSLLCETPNSVQFAEWNPWTMNIKDQQTDWLFLNNPRHVPGDASFATNALPLLRQTFFGAISCFDSAGPGAPSRVFMPHGMLWMHGVIEFKDPSPLLYNYIPPQIRRLAMDANSEISKHLPEASPLCVESKEEKKSLPSTGLRSVQASDDDELEVISPPKYLPSPSTYTGSPSYKPSSRSTSTSSKDLSVSK